MQTFHLAAQLAGSDQRLADWIPACPPDLGKARASIGRDFLLIAGYVFAGHRHPPALVAAVPGPAAEAAERLVIALPAVVGALDVVENGLVLAGLDVDDGRFTYPRNLPLPITIATVAWTKWLAAAVVVVTVVMALMLAFARRNERRPTAVRHARRPEPSHRRHRTGSACAAPAVASAPPPSRSARSTGSKRAA